MSTDHTFRNSLTPWFIWIVAASFYSYEFFIRVSPSVMVSNLMQNFRIHATEVGVLSACYYYAYALLQIPVGALLDYYGIRRLLFISAIAVAVGNFLLASTKIFLVAEFCRILMGLGSAFSFVGCLKLAANWFPRRQFAFLVGLTNMLGILGAIAAQAPLAYALHYLGWRVTLIGMGIVGAILALLIRLIVQDDPRFVSCLPTCSSKELQMHTLWEGLNEIIRCRRNWLTALYGGLMVAPVSAFAELWSVPFLIQVHHVSYMTSAALASLIFFGIAVGSPVHTYLSGSMRRRKPILWVGTFGAVVCLSMVIYAPFLFPFLIGLILFLFGFFVSSMLLVFPLNVENNPAWANGIVIGFTNTFIMIGGTLFQPLVGFVLDYLWGGKVENHVQIFSPQNYRIALSLAVFSSIGALVVLKFVRETYCKQISTG